MLYTKLPEGCRIFASRRVDNLAISKGAIDIRSMVRHDLGRVLASQLTTLHMEERQQQYSTDFVVELLVFTPDQLVGLVREEAMNMTRVLNVNDLMRSPPRL
jgi:hypothetical protein